MGGLEIGGKKSDLGPLVAFQKSKHPEELVLAPSPHRAASWAGKDAEPQCRIRARAGVGGAEAPHKVWSLGNAELARFGVEWGEVRRKRF